MIKAMMKSYAKQCSTDRMVNDPHVQEWLRSANLFKEISKRYEAAGYKMPRLVFWNVASRTGTIPIKENDMGVALVSGFSVNIAKMVMSGKLDPYDCLLEAINAERYQPIEDALRPVLPA